MVRLACLRLAVGLVLSAAATAAVAGDDVGAQIVNGTLTSGYETTGVLLSGRNANRAGMVCSGTLIGCETFLTAAHCVCDTFGPLCQSLNPSRSLVFLQHAGLFQVASIAVPPSYDFPVADVAVLKLGAPVAGIIPTPIDTTPGSPSPGTGGTIVGFGRTGGFNEDYGLKRAGEVMTETCSAGVSDTTSVCWRFENPVGPPGTDSNTCNGDSGGPLFVDAGGTDVVAGVTSGGDSFDCLALDLSYDARVSFYESFIQAEGGADLSNTSCGAVPQIGEPGAEVMDLSGTLDLGNEEDVHAFAVPSGKSVLRVALNGLDDGFTNFDLYVRRGAVPTPFEYDCRAKGGGQFGFCEFHAVESGTWHALVTRVRGAGAYQLTIASLGTDCSTAGDGSPCDDGDPCTENDVCQTGTCAGAAAAPRSGCLAAAAGVFSVLDRATDDRDQIVWKWTSGPATDFGDPTSSSDLALCAYDNDGPSPNLLFGITLPAGGFCEGKPCWKATSSGARFRDRDRRNRGVQTARVKETPDGAAKVVLRAKGASAPLPSLPLTLPVRVQLGNETTCWEAVYGVASRNDGAVFRATPD